MSTRKKILDTIALNKPAFKEMPAIDTKSNEASTTDLPSLFSEMLKSIGGQVRRVKGYDEIRDELLMDTAHDRYMVNTVAELGEANPEIGAHNNAHELETVYRACIPGTIGVAENGSVWVDEKQMINRLLPFICQHLVIVLNESRIVPDMHEAYRQIDTNREAYGLFIAGPSKTADIEQSLVIGAHGARSLIVYLLSAG